MLLRHNYREQRYYHSMKQSEYIAKLNIEQLVEPGELFKMYVKGYSMLPLLGYGRDEIVLRRTTTEEDIAGRIAMFRTLDGRIIVHRIIDIKDGIVTLRGDGNIEQCERCAREDIIGIVESVVRGNGRTISCTTRWWHTRERIWLGQPKLVRRYALAIMRRWCNFKRRNRE